MANVNKEIKRIRVRRGLEKDLPILSQGEFGFSTDTKTLYIGDGARNIPIARMEDQIRVYVSDVEPPNPDNNTLWYYDVGGGLDLGDHLQREDLMHSSAKLVEDQGEWSLQLASDLSKLRSGGGVAFSNAKLTEEDGEWFLQFDDNEETN